MKYKEGDKMYHNNRKTKEFNEIKIIGIKYVFDKRIGTTDTFTENQIDNLVAEGRLILTKDDYINEKIKALEDELGIKLERK